MRHLATLLLGLSTLSTALQVPNLQPFLSALPPSLLDYLPSSVNNATNHLDLLRRQNSNGCPSNYNNCASVGAASVCCNPSAICSADYAGHVACCASGAVCTGYITGVITGGTVDASGNLVGAAGATTAAGLTTNTVTTTTTTSGLIGAGGTTTTTATSTSGNGFIIQGSSTVATPGLAVRGAEIPLVARIIIKVIELVPLG